MMKILLADNFSHCFSSGGRYDIDFFNQLINSSRSLKCWDKHLFTVSRVGRGTGHHLSFGFSHYLPCEIISLNC